MMAEGQNLLRSPRLVASLLDDTSIGPGDVVVEIGAGTGVITIPLSERSKLVVAVENDPGRVEQLRTRLAGIRNVELYQEDFLGFALPTARYKVFSNIPFHRTAEIVHKLTASGRPPEDSYLVVQRAAALRFLGRPDADDSMASILLKPFFSMSMVHNFRRTDFQPVPDVDVVLLHLHLRDSPDIHPADAQSFRDFVVFAYTQWRPALRLALRPILTDRQFQRLARELGIARTATPTDLDVDRWVGLFKFVRTLPPPIQSVFAGTDRRVRRRDAKTEKIHRTREAPDWRLAPARISVPRHHPWERPDK